MSKKLREVIIIPDNTMDLLAYRQELMTPSDRHGKIIKNFLSSNQLEFPLENPTIKNNDNGYLWGIEIAKIGYVAIEKDDSILFFFPDVLFPKQYQYLKEHKKEYRIYQNNIRIINVTKQNEEFQLETYSPSKISKNEKMIDFLYDLIEEKKIIEKKIRR